MFARLFPACKALRLTAACLSTALLAACDPAMMAGMAPGAGPRVDASGPVRVALLVPRSDAAAGTIARDLENAARLALADLDGAEIDLAVYDTAGRSATAATQAQRAVDEGAQIILGPLFGEAANAAAIAVADEGVNVLSFSNNTTIAGGNLFVLGATFQSSANRLVGYGADRGIDDIAVLYQDNIAGQLGRNAIQSAASRNGARVVAAEGYALNTESLTGAIGRVSPLTQSGDADALFLTDQWDGGLSVVLQLAPEQGISPSATQYAGITRWDARRDGFNLAGIEGGWFAMPDQAATQRFESRYRARYGAAPLPLAGLSFDGIAAVGALLSRGRSDALTGRALTQASGFQGASGVFRLLPNGTNERGLAVATVRGGSISILDPAPRAFGGAGF